MRKQSWQVRLIPLFYSAGIIKGLSNNNYAPKVDTPLSCSRCEWQRGVCATEVGEEEVRLPGCVNVPDDVCARMHEKLKKGK